MKSRQKTGLNKKHTLRNQVLTGRKTGVCWHHRAMKTAKTADGAWERPWRRCAESLIELQSWPARSFAGVKIPFSTRTLVEVARLAPNHLSADLLLRYARGQLVQTLTLEASLDELLTIGRPFLTIRFVPTMIWQNNNLRFVPEARVEKISQEAATKARDRLVSLRPRLDPRTLDLSDTLVECINYRGGQQKLGLVKPSAAYLQARDRVIGWLTSMLSDPKVLEELTVKISDGDGKGSRP